MPELYQGIPLDLELLRVGLHMDETHAIVRYALEGHDREYYCLVRDADILSPATFLESAYLTIGLLSEYSGTAGISHPPHGETLLTSPEKFDARTLNANSPFTGQQRRNIQMAFDNLEPGMCLGTARAFAERNVDSWTAFEVCAAMRDHFPTQFIKPLLDEGRSHQQVRELRHLAECLRDERMYWVLGNNIGGAYLAIADRRDLTPEQINGLRRTILAAHIQFDPAWLNLDEQQLGRVRFALLLGIPFDEVCKYGDGRFTADAMGDITNAYMSLSDSGREYLPLIMRPEFTIDHLREAVRALEAFDLGTIDANALKLIADPCLPQPVMEALRSGLSYYGLSTEDAKTLIEQEATDGQVWDLIEGGAEQEEAVPVDGMQEAPHQIGLHDAAKEQREASGQLSRSEGHEAQDVSREEKA